MLKTFKIALTVFHRDLMIYRRRQSEWMIPFVYFIMILSLFPLGLSLSPKLLKEIAPGIVWVSVVLSLLTSLENRYRSDFEEGFIEQLILKPCPLPILLLGKAIAHWIIFGLPMLLLTPIVAILFNLSWETGLALVLTLLIGLPTLSLTSSIGVVLTLSLPRGGLFLTILLLPLTIPLIVFGSSSMIKAAEGLPYEAELFILLALLILALILAPLTSAYVLKMSIE